MPPKSKPQLALNMPPPKTGYGGLPLNSSDNVAHPANATIGAPYDLLLTTATGYSSAAPTAVIDATWKRPLYSNPANYTIQVSTSSTFTASGTITAPTTPGVESAHIEGLLPGTLYYVRVRANAPGAAWSSMSPLTTGVNRITTATDTTAAGVPTSPAAAWSGIGDLIITWVNPTNANFKTVHIRVRAASGGTIYREWESASQREIYTYSMNLTDTSGVGDSSLYVELWSVTFSNVASATVNTGLVTKGVPGTPAGLTQSWTGDPVGAGVAGPDLTISWTDQNDRYYYNLTLDGVARRVWGNSYTFTLDANRAQHSGTPDASFAYSLTASDGFNLTSTAVSGTATNAAPAAPVATLTAGAVAGLFATVTSTPPADFWRYEFVFKRDGTTVATVFSTGATYRYEMGAAGDDGYHSWTVVVRQEDVFAQFSATHTPSAVAFEALTLSWLRSGAIYSDSAGNTDAALQAALADDVKSSGGISYAP